MVLGEMTNLEIDAIFQGQPKYLGCYARNKIPKWAWKKTGFMIVNMDDLGGGTHWVYGATDEKNNYYFDSFGMPPPTQVRDGMKKSGKKCFFNTIQIQDDDSSSCGWFCCYFGLEDGVKGRYFVDVLNDFTYKPMENERKLLDYFKNI